MPLQGSCGKVGLVAVPFRPSEIVDLAARRLRAARLALGVLQQDMARACGAEPNRWSNWEKARTLPDPLVIAQAQLLYGISLDWVYAGDPGNLPGRILDRIRTEHPELLERVSAPAAPAPARRATG
jgi:transcriptional regulator with XRE-family HTH domain